MDGWMDDAVALCPLKYTVDPNIMSPSPCFLAVARAFSLELLPPVVLIMLHELILPASIIPAILQPCFMGC